MWFAMLFDPYSFLPPLGWLFFSILATSAWSLLIRVLNKDEKDYLASVAATDGLSTLMLVVVILILGADFGFDGNFDLASIPLHMWIFVFATAFLYAGFIFYTFKGSQHVEGSIRPVLSQTQSIWAVLISFLFLAEAASLQKLFAIAIIIFGSVLSLWSSKKMDFVQRGVGAILFASFLLGIASVADKVILKFMPSVVYPLFTFAIPCVIFIFLMGRNAPKRILCVLKKRFWVSVLLSFFSILSFISLLLALSKLEASITIPLFNTFVIVTAFGGMVFLGEKSGWQYKIAGAIFAFIGAVLIS